MSLLCKFIFGILVIKLGLNLHGFSLEADNLACNQNPVTGIQVRFFNAWAEGRSMWGFVCCIKQWGGFYRRKSETEWGRSFARIPLPGHPVGKPTQRWRGLSLFSNWVWHTQLWLGFSPRVSSCSPGLECPQKGRTEGVRFAPLWWEWCICFGLWLTPSWKRKTGSASIGDFTQAWELEPRCAKTSGHLSQLSPCVDAAAHPRLCSEDVIPEPHAEPAAKAARAAVGRGCSGQPRCAARRQMGFHRRRSMTYWKAPSLMAAFSFPTNLIMEEQNWFWTYLGNGLVAVFFYVSFVAESSMLAENIHILSWEHKSNTNRNATAMEEPNPTHASDGRSSSSLKLLSGL